MSLLNTNIGPERVQVFPQPIGVVQVPGAATSTPAILISTSLSTAPVNIPTTVTDLNTFLTTFGGPDQAGQGYYNVEAYYNNAGSGTAVIVVNVGDGVKQVETITTVADVSGSLNDTYFYISSADNKTNYYVWYNINSAGTDPMVAGKTGIMVAGSTNATANTLASATATALTLANDGLDFLATASTDVVTVTNQSGGPSTAPVDGSVPTGFTFAVVTGGVDVSANDYIGNSATGTGLRALDPIDVIGLVACPGLPLSLAYLVQPAVINYAKTIRAEFGATLSTTFSLTAIPQEITTSQVDNQLLGATAITVISSNTVTLGTANLSAITPGMIVNSGGVFQTIITAVNAATHQITVLSATNLTVSQMVELAIPCAVNYKELVVNDPSRSNGWYFNWLVVLDESEVASPGELLNIDPVGAVAGVIASIDANTSIGAMSHAPAGIQYAGISGIQGLQLTLSERIDAAPLRLNFINRITSFPGSGNVIFGGYTSDSGTSPQFTADDELIQVIRTVQFIKASLETGLRAFLWENYSPATVNTVSNAIVAFLRSNSYLFPAGLPEAQQFTVAPVTPTQEMLDAGLLQVIVQVRPNQAIRFIEIDLQYPIPTA